VWDIRKGENTMIDIDSVFEEWYLRLVNVADLHMHMEVEGCWREQYEPFWLEYWTVEDVIIDELFHRIAT
jgi:mannose/cellobiose epimerase-like protein (N-acyl-D-glucosamine 2-epimerase family)